MQALVNSGHDTYYCSARQADKTKCSQRPIKRTLLDDTVRDYFAEIGLDIDATRRQVTDALDRRQAELKTLRQQAERQVGEAEAAVQRVKRDYTTGAITADEWHELRPDLMAEASAATAEVERVRAQEAAEARAHPEAGVLREVVALRADIIGNASVEQIRAALLRLFEAFHLMPADDVSAPDVPDDTVLDHVLITRDLELWPQPHARAVIGIDEEMVPVLSRTPLHTQGQSDHVALPL